METTPAIIRWSAIIRSSTSRRSPTAETRLFGNHRRDGPPWKTAGWRRLPNVYSSRCFGAILPEVRDFWMPWEGVFHNIVVMAIDKEYPGHARRIMSAVWGQGQMSFSKAVVLVDSGVDLKDPRKVLETILDQVDLESDVFITEGILDVLDHSAPDPLFGAKIGIDATRRLPDERQRPKRRKTLQSRRRGYRK